MAIDGERLMRIETKLDAFIETQNEHTRKIESLQTRINWGHGVLAAVLFILTFLGDGVRSVLFGK